MTKKKAVTRDDTDFGRLTQSFSGLWERSTHVELFGTARNLRLTVDIDGGEGVEDNQTEAYDLFIKREKRVMREAEKALLHYYSSICDECRSRLGITDPGDERVPIIRSVRELSRLVDVEGIHFPQARPVPTFGLLFKCTWDEEHGAAVRFENGDVAEAGPQDIVL